MAGQKDKVVLAYSGGLDTSVCIKWLQEEKGLDVIAVVGDVGQEHEGLEKIKQKALKTGALDCVVVDELPATFLTENTRNHSLKCAALYYNPSEATQEQYAICVTPGKDDLLNAINEVLEEMIANKEIDALVSKHLGLGN